MPGSEADPKPAPAPCEFCGEDSVYHYEIARKKGFRSGLYVHVCRNHDRQGLLMAGHKDDGEPEQVRIS